eukprot:UN13479
MEGRCVLSANTLKRTLVNIFYCLDPHVCMFWLLGDT